MGCDIHSYLEKYTSINGENKWVNVDYWQINPHHGIVGYQFAITHGQGSVLSVYRQNDLRYRS
jgi:hypothetical protein